MARPLTLPHFVVLRQNVLYIYFQKFLISQAGKLDQSSPKSVKTCYDQRPSLYQNSSRSAKQCTRKGLHFYPMVNFGTPGDSLGKSSPNMETVYSMCQISSRSDNLCTRYLLPDLLISLTA